MLLQVTDDRWISFRLRRQSVCPINSGSGTNTCNDSHQPAIILPAPAAITSHDCCPSRRFFITLSCSVPAFYHSVTCVTPYHSAKKSCLTWSLKWVIAYDMFTKIRKWRILHKHATDANTNGKHVLKNSLNPTVWITMQERCATAEGDPVIIAMEILLWRL